MLLGVSWSEVLRARCVPMSTANDAALLDQRAVMIGIDVFASWDRDIGHRRACE